MNISLYYLKPQYEEFFRQSFDTIVNTTNANPKKSYYEKVFSGKVDDKNSINDLFTILTDNMPSDFVGHDFGVSDVIGIDTDGDKLKAGEFYFCDIIGWDRLKEWEEPKQTESLIETIDDSNTVSYWATDGEFRGSKIRHNKHGEGVHFFATLEDALSGAQLLQKTHLYEIHHKPLTKPLVIDEDLILWSGDHIAELLLCKLDNKDYDIWGDGKDFIKPSQVHIDNLTEDDRPILQSITGQKQDDFDKVYDFIKSKGFDHIKYKNTQELQNGDSIIVNPDDIDIQYPLTQVEYKRNESMDKKKKVLDPKNVFGKRVLGAKKEAFDLDRYELLDHKTVYDSDGFTTDYALYFDHDENNYFTVFGDMDLYTPDNSDHDMDFDNNEEEARDWFAYYEGIYDGDDDWFYADSEISDDINESADDIPNWFKSLYYEAKEKYGDDYSRQLRYITVNSAMNDDDTIKWLKELRNQKTDEKLIQSSSDKAFKKNVATEIKAGKPQKQALAIAYDVKRKNESVDDDFNKEDWDEAERIYQKHGYAISLLNVLCKWNELSPNAEPDKDFYKPLHNRYYWRELMDLAYDIDQSYGYTGDYLGESKGKGMIDVLGKPNDTNEGLQDITKDFANARKQFDKYGLDIKFDDALKLFNKKSKLAEPDTFYAKPLYNKDAFDDLVKIATEECGVEEVKEGIEELDDGWKEVSGRNGYRLFRKIEDGKGKWRAQKCVNGKCEGEPFDITYAQALGREPIEDKPVAELSKKLGKILLPRYSKDESLNESGRPLNRRERTSYITKLVKLLMAEPYNYDHETANDIAIRRADNIDHYGYVKEYDGTIDDMVKRELRFTATKAEYEARKTESVGGDDAPLRVCRQCLMGIEAHEGKQRAKHIYIDDEDTYDDHDEWERDSKCDWCEETGFDELWEI